MRRSTASIYRSFWSLAENIFNNCRSTFSYFFFRVEDAIAVSPAGKTPLFGSHFVSLSLPLDDSDVLSPLTEPLTFPIIAFHAVRKALISFRTNKAQETDGILPQVAMGCTFNLTPVLDCLFCLCLNAQTLFSYCKHVLIQPVQKKDDHSNPSNYCPTALNSALSKAFESRLCFPLAPSISQSDQQSVFL